MSSFPVVSLMAFVLFTFRAEIPLLRRLSLQQWGLILQPAHDMRIRVPTRFGHPVDYRRFFVDLISGPVPLAEMVRPGEDVCLPLYRAALILEGAGSLRETAWHMVFNADQSSEDRREYYE